MAKEETKTTKLKRYFSKGEGGSWLYGIILIATGAFVIVLGVLNILNIDYISDFLISQGWADWAAMLPTMGVTNFVVGTFAVIAGYGLVIDQEWGWGIAMFILVYTAAQAIVQIAHSANELLISPTSLNALGTLVVASIATAVAVVGLVYLGLTKYKYA